jgi:hypothetical protein
LIRTAAAFALLLAACMAHVAVRRWVAAPPQTRKRADPIAQRRDKCLAPPFTLEHDEPKLSNGMRVEPRGDGLTRDFYVATHRGQPFDADGLIAFRDRNAAALRTIDGVESSGLSGCPTREGPSPCIHLDLRLCARSLDELTSDLSRIVAADNEVLGRQVIFHVTLTGAAGPRCEADDARCRPEPYEAAEYDPSARRGLIAPAPQGGEPQCTWDGECKKSGCGNSCELWTQAHRPGTCDERAELRDALCGCVDQRCAWFVQ